MFQIKCDLLMSSDKHQTHGGCKRECEQVRWMIRGFDGPPPHEVLNTHHLKFDVITYIY